MVKIKNPLLSLRASGLVGAISYLRRRKTDIAEKIPVVPDQKSPAQLSWRHMYQKAVALWHALSPAEQLDWESQARPRHMTGFAWFMSQALKPNPGLYLPLQGGTMAGDVDMAKHRILKLPSPTDTQEPLTLAFFTAQIAPFLYDEGARAYHNIAQAIPTNSTTVLALNSERWDSDSIHDNVTNNSRLTCKTAGVYIITASARFAGAAGGHRSIGIRLNGAIDISYFRLFPTTDVAVYMIATTVYDLSIGDYVETIVYQTSGAPLNIDSSPQISPEFMMQRISR